MELFLRDNDLTDWIDLEGGVSLKVAYPTYEQEKDLSAKLTDLRRSDIETNSKPVIEYYAALIKYCVKDWKGVINIKTKEPVLCELVNNELAPYLLAALVRDAEVVAEIAVKIKSQIDFTETDKKKL